MTKPVDQGFVLPRENRVAVLKNHDGSRPDKGFVLLFPGQGNDSRGMVERR